MLAVLAMAAALSATGCSSNPGTSLPVWAGGEPPGLPPKTADAPTNYPNVQALPPARPTKPVSEAEQNRLEAELNALRKRVNAESGAARRDKNQ